MRLSRSVRPPRTAHERPAPARLGSMPEMLSRPGDQSTSTVMPGRYAAGKECWSGRRVQAWSSPLAKAIEQRVCQVLNDAPIGVQGYVFAGECTCRGLRRTAAATSDSRTLGRRAAEIRTGCLIGVETGHREIRMGPRGGAEAAAAPRQGEPSPPVSRLALARCERWHAACCLQR